MGSTADSVFAGAPWLRPSSQEVASPVVGPEGGGLWNGGAPSDRFAATSP